MNGKRIPPVTTWLVSSLSVLVYATASGVAASVAAGAAEGPTVERRAPTPALESAGALFRAHLQQARALETPARLPVGDAALLKLKAELEARRRTWLRRLDGADRTAAGPADLADPAGLLAGIPLGTRETARRAAADVNQAAALLKNGVSLELLLSLTAARNPDVHVARRKVRALTERYRQAAYLEDLLARYRSFVRELNLKVGPPLHKEPLKKIFPFPATLSLKGRLADEEVEIAWLRSLSVLRRKLNAVARGFFEVQYLTAAAKIVAENRGLLSQMAAVSKERLKTARGAQADLLKAQSALAVTSERLRTLRRQRTEVVARVNALLDLPAGAVWGPLRETNLRDEKLSAQKAAVTAREKSQEAAAARKAVELKETMVRLAEVVVLPSGSRGMSMLSPGAGAAAGPTRNQMTTFPEKPAVGRAAAGFGANAAYIAELRVRVKEARARLRAVLAERERATATAYFRADVGRREWKTYAETVEPKAAQAYKTLKGRYVVGRTPFIEYLDAQRTWLDAALSREKARRDFNQGSVELLDAEGRSAAALLGPAMAKKPAGKRPGGKNRGVGEGR